jgi:hypothetical protein
MFGLLHPGYKGHEWVVLSWLIPNKVVIVPNLIRAATIRETIEKRLNLWDAGSYDGLVQEVLIAGKCGVAGRNSHSWKEDGEVSESVAKKYNSMVLDGKLRGAV